MGPEAIVSPHCCMKLDGFLCTSPQIMEVHSTELDPGSQVQYLSGFSLANDLKTLPLFLMAHSFPFGIDMALMYDLFDQNVLLQYIPAS